ncbi:hypothetical protein WA158_006113 [Blastocystis sp. Blastoise]
MESTNIITFTFQDDTVLSVSKQFLSKYPDCTLSKISSNSLNLLEDNTYYVDYSQGTLPWILRYMNCQQRDLYNIEDQDILRVCDDYHIFQLPMDDHIQKIVNIKALTELLLLLKDYGYIGICEWNDEEEKEYIQLIQEIKKPEEIDFTKTYCLEIFLNESLKDEINRYSIYLHYLTSLKIIALYFQYKDQNTIKDIFDPSLYMSFPYLETIEIILQNNINSPENYFFLQTLLIPPNTINNTQRFHIFKSLTLDTNVRDQYISLLTECIPDTIQYIDNKTDFDDDNYDLIPLYISSLHKYKQLTKISFEKLPLIHLFQELYFPSIYYTSLFSLFSTTEFSMLETLDLSYTNLNGMPFHQLCSLLSSYPLPHFKELFLNNMNLYNEDIISLSLFLMSNTSFYIETLEIANNNIKASSIISLSNIILNGRFNHIQVLNLSYSSIYSDGFIPLLESLINQKISSMKELYISWRNATPKVLQLYIHYITSICLSSFTTIDIRNISIECTDHIQLLPFPHHPQVSDSPSVIETIILDSCLINDTYIHSFYSTFQNLSLLQNLSLASNQLTTTSLLLLFLFINKLYSTTFLYIDFSDNPVSLDFFTYLYNYIQTNSSRKLEYINNLFQHNHNIDFMSIPCDIQPMESLLSIKLLNATFTIDGIHNYLNLVEHEYFPHLQYLQLCLSESEKNIQNNDIVVSIMNHLISIVKQKKLCYIKEISLNCWIIPFELSVQLIQLIMTNHLPRLSDIILDTSYYSEEQMNSLYEMLEDSGKDIAIHI